MHGLFTSLDAPSFNALLRRCLFIGLSSVAGSALAAAEIQFNTDILDLNDRNNIDLSQFSRSGFILPGTYSMAVEINAQTLPEQKVAFHLFLVQS